MASRRGIIATSRALAHFQRQLSCLSSVEGSTGANRPAATSWSYASGSQNSRRCFSYMADSETATSNSDSVPEFETRKSGSGAITMKLDNCPKYALKSEILDFFRSLDLSPDCLNIQVSERLRFNNWQITFKDAAQLQLAQEVVALKSTIGARRINLVPTDLLPEVEQFDPLLPLKGYKGRSLMLFGISEVVMSDVLEKFFEGYGLAPNAFKHYNIKPEFMPSYLRKGPLPNSETRILVKFETRAEALRALKDLHKSMLGNNAVILRLIE